MIDINIASPICLIASIILFINGLAKSNGGSYCIASSIFMMASILLNYLR